MKKTVLVYGDSNVWGDTPETVRLPDSQQWANIMQEELGREEYKVVQEGLAGRFAGDFCYEKHPYFNYFNGQYCYEPIYRTASPVDIVVMALGTNDLNDKHNRTLDEIVNDVLWYESKTKTLVDEDEVAPIFLYILPPNLVGRFREDETFSLEKRKEVNEVLKHRIENFVEIDDIDLSADGLHFSVKGHERMARAVSEKIRGLER